MSNMKTYTIQEMREKVDLFVDNHGIFVTQTRNETLQEFLSWLEEQEENTPTLKSLIDSWKFDWVNSDIEKNFKLNPIRSSDYKLFHFDESISSENAIAEMEKEGYSPANAIELLSWKDWNDKDFVIAIGSAVEVDGGRYALCLLEIASKRRLGLLWFDGDWIARYRFLAIRNLSLNTKTLEKSELGNLDSLKLEKDIFKCDKCNGQKVRVRGGGMICPNCDLKKQEKTVSKIEELSVEEMTKPYTVGEVINKIIRRYNQTY